MPELPLSCIAIQSKANHHSRWFLDAKTCKTKFDQLVCEPTFDRSTISRFELTIDDQLPTDRASEIVDIAAATAEYEPLQRRIGTDRLLVEHESTASAQ